MMSPVWAAVLASKSAKIGTGVVAGGSSLMIILNMIGGRIDEVNSKIDYKVQQTQTYVDLKHDRVMVEIENIGRGQSEIRDILKVIEKRMYDERNKRGGI